MRLSALIALVLLPLFSAFSAEPLPGWSTSYGDSTLPGLVTGVAPSSFSTPVIVDLDNNSANGNEIVVAGGDGNLVAYSSAGAVLWRAQVPSARCSSGSRTNKMMSTPAASDLLGDGQVSVVIGYGGISNSGCGGGVVAFRGTDGSRLWTFDVRAQSSGERWHTVFSTPAIADVDGDGKKEIGFGTWDRRVYLLDSNGRLIWKYVAADTVWSSPSFADVDGDGKLEMIIGTDISENKHLKTKNGGIIYALRAHLRPSRNKQYWFQSREIVKWSTAFDQVLFGAPVVGDIDINNPGDEVVIGTGCYFSQGSVKKGAYYQVVSARTGRKLRTLPIGGCSPSSPALADLDGDGEDEVIVNANAGRAQPDGRVIAFDGRTGAQLWSVAPRATNSGSPRDIGTFRSPVVADLDGNGSLEVAVNILRATAILDAHSGAQLSCAMLACDSDRWMIEHGEQFLVSPSFGDIDGDGTMDLVTISKQTRLSRDFSVLSVFHNFYAEPLSNGGIDTPFAAPWPQTRYGASRAGHR